MSDASSAVYRTLAVILDCCQNLEREVGSDSADPCCTPSVSLIRLLDAADDLVQYVIPDREPAEHQGVPRVMLPPGRMPLRFSHVDRPEWDFAAWFGEKSATVKSAVKSLIKIWLQIANHPTSTGGGLAMAELAERRRLALATAKAYAQVIFQEVHDDALLIRYQEGDD